MTIVILFITTLLMFGLNFYLVINFYHESEGSKQTPCAGITDPIFEEAKLHTEDVTSPE